MSFMEFIFKWILWMTMIVEKTYKMKINDENTDEDNKVKITTRVEIF